MAEPVAALERQAERTARFRAWLERLRAELEALDEGEVCVRCGNPARGFAMIDQDRFCHGDEDDSPTCYEAEQWARSDG